MPAHLSHSSFNINRLLSKEIIEQYSITDWDAVTTIKKLVCQPNQLEMRRSVYNNQVSPSTGIRQLKTACIGKALGAVGECYRLRSRDKVELNGQQLEIRITWPDIASPFLVNRSLTYKRPWKDSFWSVERASSLCYLL